MKWSTNTVHRVKVVKYQNEVNDDSRKENETVVHRRLQARCAGSGDRARGGYKTPMDYKKILSKVSGND